MNWRREIIVIGVLLFIAFLMPWVLTRPAFVDGLDFSNSGDVGNTIGGILGPMISLIAAYLLFRTLQVQVITISQERNFNSIMRQLESLKSDYRSLNYGAKDGKQALNAYTNRIKAQDNIENSFIYLDYRYIVESVLLINEHIEMSDLSEEARRSLFSSLQTFVDNKLNNQARLTIEKIEKHTSENQRKSIRLYQSLVELRRHNWVTTRTV
jgi:hypothetical protein